MFLKALLECLIFGRPYKSIITPLFYSGVVAAMVIIGVIRFEVFVCDYYDSRETKNSFVLYIKLKRTGFETFHATPIVYVHFVCYKNYRSRHVTEYHHKSVANGLVIILFLYSIFIVNRYAHLLICTAVVSCILSSLTKSQRRR